MNISPDGVTVSFKTERESLFLAEKSGNKSNTVRIIDQYEYKQLKKSLPHKIMIRRQHEIFLRTLTHVYVSDMVLGQYIAIFSWTDEDHHHIISTPSEDDPLAHDMRIDSVEPEIEALESKITLPTMLLADLDGYRGKDTYSALISKMLEAYTTPPHCHPPAWTIRFEDKRNENGT